MPRSGSTSVLGHTFGVDEDDVLLPVPAGSGSSSSSLNPAARRRGGGGDGELRRSFAKRCGRGGGVGRLGFGRGGGRPPWGAAKVVVLWWPAPSPCPSLYRWNPQVLDYKSSNKTPTQNLPCVGKPTQGGTPTSSGIPTLPYGGVAGPLGGVHLGLSPLGLAGHGWWSPSGTPPSKVISSGLF